MPQVKEQDVEAIKDWLSKEPYLPNTFDDIAIKKFLFSCDCSLERTKRCIEEFCTRRANMPEVYSNRNPMSKELQKMFSVTTVTTYMDGVDEILIHQLMEVPSNFDFYVTLKSFGIQADNWINLNLDVLPENHIIVLDIKQYTLSLLAKVNIFYFQKFLIYLLESMPVRLKQVHVINCPSFYEYMYNLVKPALPEYICKLIQFHADYKGLYQFIDQKSLPKEYGGDKESMVDQQASWVKLVNEKRKLFEGDDFWKADLSKKPKNGTVDSTMSGSFRTLAID